MQSLRTLLPLCRRAAGSSASTAARDFSHSNVSRSVLSNSLTSRAVSTCHGPLNIYLQHMKMAVKSHASRWPTHFMIQMRGICDLTTSGRKLCAGSFLGIFGFAGAMHLSRNVAHAMTGEIEGYLQDSEDPSDFLKEDLGTLWGLTKKFQLPVVLFLTVVFGWRHPIVLAVNVALLLFCTKPNPFSVYIFIEQLRRRAIHQSPGLSKTKLFYARKVDVQDYKLLCFARVELYNARLSLIGILGSWWILSSSN